MVVRGRAPAKEKPFPMRKPLHAQIYCDTLTDMFCELLAAVGKESAAAGYIEARVGPISQGTLTKIKSGDLAVPIAWVWALEDATGNYCFTRMRNRELQERGALDPQEVCHLSTLREATEAVTAQAAAEHSDDPEVLRRALKETLDVRSKCDSDVAFYQAKLAALGIEAAQ